MSLSQNRIRPIVRGKATASVEFEAKIELSVEDGFFCIEDLRWDAFNEYSALQASAERYKCDYGHYPARILTDTIFRTRENLRYCAEHGIHMNSPKLGKPHEDPAERKRRYTMDRIVTKLKETSEVSIHATISFMNLREKLCFFCAFFSDSCFKRPISHGT